MKVGLQIHMQISNKKLFCNCSFSFRNNKLKKQILLPINLNSLEYKKHIYCYSPKNCKYELDEASPVINKKLLKKGLQVCKIFNYNVVDELLIMRKYILDGSLSSGFQRTGILGVNGNVELNERKIKLQCINIEEDSCRRKKNKWIVDRQGVGLIEITTEPIQNPEKNFIRNLAFHICKSLQNLRFRSKIGSIRQDINVDNGLGKVQIKGVQDLSLFDKIIDTQCLRQTTILNLLDKLNGDLHINYIEDKNILHAIQISCTNIFEVMTQQIVDNNLIDELEDYLKYYKIQAKQCIKITPHEIKIILGNTKSENKKHIFKFFEKLGKKEFKCTRNLNGIYSRFLRDEQTGERMNFQTELKRIDLKEEFNKIKIPLKKEILVSNLNTHNQNILTQNKQIANIINSIAEICTVDDNNFNIILKIYNSLTINKLQRRKILKQLINLLHLNKITKLQSEYIVKDLNSGQKLEEILTSSKFSLITEKELKEIISQTKYTNNKQLIAILLKKLGPRVGSYELLCNQVNKILQV